MYLEYDVADYFNSIVSLQDKKILDFGCGPGNFVKYGFKGNYTGLDVRKEVIEKNIASFPDFKWIHSNNHNNQYNPNNIVKNLDLSEKYDLICAFSVFTHTCFSEFKSTVEQLKNSLTQDGKILITFIDIEDENAIKELFIYRKNILKNVDLEHLLKKCKTCNTISLAVNTETLETNIFYDQYDIPNYDQETYFITLYNKHWIKESLDAEIFDVTHKYNDIRGVQKCLVIS